MEWQFVDPGYWVDDSNSIGLCREKNVWYVYYKGKPLSERRGPFKTKKAAAKWVEENQPLTIKAMRRK